MMSDVGLIARREVVERGRTKAFLVSNAIILLAIVALTFIPMLLDDNSPRRVGAVGSAALSITEKAATIAPADSPVEAVSYPDRAAAEAAVRDDSVSAVVIAAGAGAGPASVTVLVREDLSEELRQTLTAAAQQQDFSAALDRAGVPIEQQSALLRPPALAVSQLEPGKQTRTGPVLAFGTIATFLLYGLLIFYGQTVAQGVVEEKASRTVEVLLSAVSPNRLLAGKVLGLGILGLLQVLVLSLVGGGLAVGTGQVELTGSLIGTLALIVAWFVLGYAVYAALFAAAASLVARQEDLQSAVTPVVVVLVLALFAAQYSLSEPESLVSRVSGIFPLTAPLVQPLRYAAGTTDLWEVPVAIVLCLAAVVVLIPVAARFYTGGALRTGGRMKLGEAWRAAAADRSGR